MVPPFLIPGQRRRPAALSLLDRPINNSHQIFINSPSYRKNKTARACRPHRDHEQQLNLEHGQYLGNYLIKSPGERERPHWRKAMKAAQGDHPDHDSPFRHLVRITHGSTIVAGCRRTYTLAEPTSAGPGSGLVLVFHGSKQTGEKFRTFTGSSFDAVASTGRAVVAYLDGYKGRWNDARAAVSFPARTKNVDDVAFAETMISMLQESHQVDASKVYAVGYSNGGQLVIRLIHQVPGLLVGAAVISATQPTPDNFLLADAPPVALPVVLIHGTSDPIVAYQGGAMSWWGRRMFRVGGISLSAPQTAAYYAARNAITRPPDAADLPHREESGKSRSPARTTSRRASSPSPSTPSMAAATRSQARARPPSSWARQPATLTQPKPSASSSDSRKHLSRRRSGSGPAWGLY